MERISSHQDKDKNPSLSQDISDPPLNLDSFGEGEVINVLTDYFRRTSRGRVVELPRWAQW